MSRINKTLKLLIKKYYQNRIGNHPFSIISNDCWGGEVYKILDREFNTPFIGLMLMSPDYIKLLSNFEHNMSLALEFVDEAKYDLVNDLLKKNKFPIARLKGTDIEIVFLHYKNAEEANEKWEKRKQRIDYKNLFIKYDCGKDYSSLDDVISFNQLPFKNKLIFGSNQDNDISILTIKKYDNNALIQFKNCLSEFDVFGWLKEEPILFQNNKEKFVGKLAAKYLFS